ncbi:unnamed protein product [Miscanthus lutarioriparius]|uniref:DUF4371 domain-containing protein n=1 Tax=Miscanthus lutarioriparius TaxID=422564 RepID=A0A811QIN7_9POAL|nr:unnamed protein product [Miscanthus lutarioriparius]
MARSPASQLSQFSRTGNVIERFLGIQRVSDDTTSPSLKEALDAMIARYGLSISRIIGQGYDGDSNMRTVSWVT